MSRPDRVPEDLPPTRVSEVADVDPDTIDGGPDPTKDASALAPQGATEVHARRLGRYEVVARIGAGGMGEVFAVRDPELGRDVAAKVAHGRPTEAVLAKFYREARISGALEHPGIVPVHELSRAPDGRVFFTMKRIEGADLAAVLRRGELLPRLLQVFVKVCEAMGFAHARGVVHRDLKPANILVGEHGEVYVCDWGLARRLDGAPDAADAAVRLRVDKDATRTVDGTVMGTPTYMSPEQAAGRTDLLDGRSDVYSLGAILYEILAGVPPYSGADGWKVIEAVVAGPPPPPSSRALPGRSIPWELEAICAKAMERDRDRRYATAGALIADLEAFRAGRVVGAARYGVVEGLRKWLALHPVLVRSSVVVALAGAALVAYRAVEHGRAVREAWVAVERSDYAALVAAAQEVPLDPDPARRPPPTASQRSQWMHVADGLQAASQMLADVLALEPGHAPSRRAHAEVLLALGRIAEAGHDDALAVQAYRLAATMDTDRAAALALATRAGDAREARRRDQLARVDARLAQARAGELASDWAYRDAVVELASFRERSTVDALVATVDRTAALLEDAVRAALAEAVEPTAVERARGEGRLEGIASAVEAWIAWRGTMLDAGTIELVHAAVGRLARREDPRTPPGQAFAAGSVIVARRQSAALAAGKIDRARELSLACEALGLLGDDAATDALERAIRADWSEARAVLPGISLVRLSSRSPRARARLVSTLGFEEGGMGRFDQDGVYGRTVGRELAATRSTSVTASEPTTPRAWFERALRFEAEGDLAAALAAATRAVELDNDDVEARCVRGKLRGMAGDFAGSRADFDRALELAPARADAWSNRGETRRKAGDLAGARGDHDRALELDSSAPKAWLARAHLRVDQGDHAGAVADCTRAVELAPRDAEPYHYRAVSRFKLGDLAGAIGDLDRVIELDPRHALAFTNRGLARAMAGDVAEGLADCTRAIELDPKSAKAHTNRAVVRLRGKDYVAAKVDCDRALELDKGYVDAWLGRGSAHKALGQLPEAIADFGHAIELDPRSFQGHFDRGRFRVLVADIEGAIADLTQAIELDPASGAAVRERGIAHGVGRNASAAMADLSRAIELDPTDAIAYANRGVLREQAGDLEAALVDLGRALELAPGYAFAWRMRGGVRRGLRDAAGALSDVSRAIELDPRDADAYADRGLVGADRRDFAGAIADYDRALAIDPRRPRVLNNRAIAKHELGDLAGSIDDARRATELDPALWQAHAMLGMSLARAGRADEARGAFDAAAQAAPDAAKKDHVVALRRKFLGGE